MQQVLKQKAAPVTPVSFVASKCLRSIGHLVDRLFRHIFILLTCMFYFSGILYTLINQFDCTSSDEI